jgi:hypothetical protein
MRSVQSSEGMSGVRRYMADAVTDPRLAFDGMLKLASRRAILYGDAGRLDEAFAYLEGRLGRLQMTPQVPDDAESLWSRGMSTTNRATGLGSTLSIRLADTVEVHCLCVIRFRRGRSESVVNTDLQ